MKMFRCPHCDGKKGFQRSYMYAERHSFFWDGKYRNHTERKFVKGGMTAWCIECGAQIVELRKEKAPK